MFQGIYIPLALRRPTHQKKWCNLQADRKMDIYGWKDGRQGISVSALTVGNTGS